jgi:hypothetical protein
MSNYNSSILLKCFSDKLPCIYGVHAILREIEEDDLAGYDKTCNIYEPGINYFKIIPYDIILLIIDLLNEYDVLNFCIAIQKCDKLTLNKLVYWNDLYCFQCENVKLKYYYCHECAQVLCHDCVKKCECCDNMVRNYDFENVDLDSGTYYHIPNIGNKKFYGCANKMSVCNFINMSLMEYGNVKILSTQYHWGNKCATCGLDYCHNCAMEYDPGRVMCRKCYSLL